MECFSVFLAYHPSKLVEKGVLASYYVVKEAKGGLKSMTFDMGFMLL